MQPTEKESTMTGPFIWVGTYAIKPGKSDEAKQRLQELAELVEANEPRLIAFNFYLNEAATTASCVQVHPDAASMEFHMEVIAEHLSSASDFLQETVGQEVYGTPPAGLVDAERQWVPLDRLRVQPVHLAGFTRSNAR
jgi:hypothetical protein